MMKPNHISHNLYTDIFGMHNSWDFKNVSFFIFIILLPNLLSVFNISTPYGFNIHFFQFAIILAAIIYGPLGGAASGLVGSVYSAVMMHNPYLIVGNVILGLSLGIFLRYDWNIVLAMLAAFALQLPWLVGTDYYMVHMPLAVIFSLIIALLISDALWTTAAYYVSRPVKKMLDRA